MNAKRYDSNGFVDDLGNWVRWVDHEALEQQLAEMRGLLRRAVSQPAVVQALGEFWRDDVSAALSYTERKEAGETHVWQAGDRCPCCHSDTDRRPGYARCASCGWIGPISRQVMNPPGDSPEARNLANTAPRSPDHDGACRGMTGTSSWPEARPVTATAQSPTPPPKTQGECEACADTGLTWQCKVCNGTARAPAAEPADDRAQGVFGRTDLPAVMVYTAKLCKNFSHEMEMGYEQVVLFGDHQRALDNVRAEAAQPAAEREGVIEGLRAILDSHHAKTDFVSVPIERAIELLGGKS